MIPIDNLKDGDIILFHTKGFSIISWGIRILTESYWNHVGMYYTDIYKQGWVIEALGRGVVRTPIDKYTGNKNYDIKAVRLKVSAFKDQKEYDTGIFNALLKMRNAIGDKYDWWAIAYLGVLYLSKGFWNRGFKKLPKAVNPWQSRNKFFCSELVCGACYGISSIILYLFQGKTKQKCDTTTPKDIDKSENVE